MKTKPDIDVILDELHTLEYLWIGSEIRTWFLGRTLGWRVCASSWKRKPYTLERLQTFIDENNLPLRIEDEHDMVNSFKVYLKDAA